MENIEPLDTKNIHRLIDRWYRNSSSDRAEIIEPFDNFIALWIAFNAWGYYTTDSKTDSDMINLLSSDSRVIASFQETKRKITNFVDQLEIVANELEIKDRNGTPHSFKDENDLVGILKVIYKIRCDLFHGGKDPTNIAHQDTVRWATYVLRHIFTTLKDRSDFMEKVH